MAPTHIKGGIGADAPFWLGLEAGELRVARCESCERWMWPAHFRCGACGSWDVGWRAVEPTGTLYTWTRNHLVSDALKERRPDLPYVTGLVELPQAGGVRLAGVLKVGEPRIGANLCGVVEPATERSRGYPTMVWHLAEATHG